MLIGSGHQEIKGLLLAGYPSLSRPHGRSVAPSLPSLIVIDGEGGPGLARGHDFQPIEVDMRGKRGDVEHLLGDILGGERGGAAIQRIGSDLVAAGAHKGEFGFGDARGEVGHAHARAE